MNAASGLQLLFEAIINEGLAVRVWRDGMLVYPQLEIGEKRFEFQLDELGPLIMALKVAGLHVSNGIWPVGNTAFA